MSFHGLVRAGQYRERAVLTILPVLLEVLVRHFGLEELFRGGVKERVSSRLWTNAVNKDAHQQDILHQTSPPRILLDTMIRLSADGERWVGQVLSCGGSGAHPDVVV